MATIVVSLLALSALAKSSTDDQTRSSLSGGVGGTKTISAVNLLLPISTCQTCGRVRQEIKATNGCYQWENSHPLLVSMTRKDGSSLDNQRQNQNECLDSVFVEAATHKETKTLSWITAKDKNSGQVLRCALRVAKPDKFGIFSRFHQISLNDVANLHIEAFDDEEGQFSTVDGFRFDWTIVEGNDKIKKMSVGELNQDFQGRQDLFVLRGVDLGKAKIRVRLLEPGYEHLQEQFIELTIIETFIISPEKAIFIMPLSQYNFSLCHLVFEDDGTLNHRAIKIPNPNYRWHSDTSVGAISDDGAFKSGVSKGTAEIKVVDTRMANNTAETEINVVYPYRLEVRLRDVTGRQRTTPISSFDLHQLYPSTETFVTQMFEPASEQELSQSYQDTYILIEEHEYLLEKFLYDAEGNQITLTDNLQFSSVNLDEQYITILKTNKIGSEILFKTKKISDPALDSKTLQTVHKLNQIEMGEQVSQFDETRIRADKELVITKPVKIQHIMDYILLPFLPAASAEISGDVWNTFATGGSGIYAWQMADTKIATVVGSASIRSQSIGKTELVVRDHRNYYNWDSITVEVANMHSFSWIEEQIEMRASELNKQGEVVDGEEHIISLVAFDNQGRKFTNCTAVNPDFSIKGEGQISLLNEVYKARSWYTKSTKYGVIKEFVRTPVNKEILILRERFDRQSGVIKASDLKSDSIDNERKSFASENQDPLFFNNFGICAQAIVASHKEGLARVKASYKVFEKLNGPSRLLESPFAEIAVYQPLHTLGKKYKPFLADLYSTNQLSQEFTSFESFYNNEQEYHLNFGTHIVWLVSGGTNFWQDYTERYQYKWNTEMENGRADGIISAQKHYESQTTFGMKIGCKNPETTMKKGLKESYKTRINLEQSSLQTRHLLRPATHQTSVAVHCDAPRQLKLLWAQQNRTEDQEGNFRAARHLPRSRVVQNERTHYVLVNSEHYLRTLVMDEKSYVSLNSTSLALKVRPSDERMASVFYTTKDDSDLGFANYQMATDLQVYDKRMVHFKNLTGTVYIESSTDGYFNRILSDVSLSTIQKDTASKTQKEGSVFGSIWKGKKEAIESLSASEKAADYFAFIGGAITPLPAGPIQSRIRVEVVKNVDVEPKFKSLYLGHGTQTYKLDLLFGSGHFSVSLNDTRIADLVHKDREVFITPRELGSLELRVEDLEIPESIVATSEILVSDIHRLTLWAPRTLIEQGDQLELTASAYDSHLNEFSKDQYDLMNFSIEAEMTGVVKQQGLRAIQTQMSNRIFEAKGIEPGIYQIVATTLKHNYLKLKTQDQQSKAQHLDEIRMTVVSEMLRLEVFPLLEVNPKELLITPNMRYTLQIVGGPQLRSLSTDGSHVEIKFDIEQKDIATVDQFREVTGHKVGDAVLKYEIIQLKTSLPPMIGTSPYNLQTNQQAVELSKVVSKRTVRIRVRLVTDIEIPLTHQRQIYVNSYIKVQAVLKFNEEYFNHGIAPISYNWNCTQSRVLNLDLPSKQELAVQLGMDSQFTMAQKTIRDGLRNDNNRFFFSAFNSSSIYATATHDGDAQLHVQLAIEYPELYRNDKNWFDTDATIKVVEKLSINVPEYSHAELKQTSLYLLPPNTVSKIQTNRKTRLNLGYSTEAIYDPVTRRYRYQESQTPIISLINDDSIRTYDKFGKVTVIVAESQTVSDQVVMLNVLIQDVYAIASMQTYDALNLPLGSELTLPIHFQDEHGHRFAEQIEGMNVEFMLSHPRVVSVDLDPLKQTVTLTSQGSGDCNIVIYMTDRPHIFDVIRVRVCSIVKPISPVFLHLGGEVEFRVASTETRLVEDKNTGVENRNKWSSSNASIMQISSTSGKAKGLGEGRADVLLSNHVSAASIVHVSRVQNAMVEHVGPMLLSTDDGGVGSAYRDDELRVRIKMFLNKHGDELMPTVQYDGITLIRQNLQIKCESSDPQWVSARGDTNDLEGYFCVMTYAGKNAKIESMPRHVKVNVYAQAENLYSQLVAQFDVQLTSSISIETKFKNGQIKLNRNNRTQVIRVFSGSDFNVKIEYDSADEGNLIKHQVTREREDQNEYRLTLTVPNQVSHSFNAKIVMSHPFAKSSKTLSVAFAADETSTPSTMSSRFTTEEYQPKVKEERVRDYEERDESDKRQGTSKTSYFVFTVFIILLAVFIMTQVCHVNLFEKKPKPQAVQPAQNPLFSRPKFQQQEYRGISESGVRERKQWFNSFSSIGGNVAGASYHDQSGRNQASTKGTSQQKWYQPGLHLDGAQFNSARDSASKRSPAKQSIYSNVDDRSGFY